MSIAAGTLTKRVTLQTLSREQDSVSGEMRSAVKGLGSVWASIEPVSGGETRRGAKVQANVTHVVRIRHRRDVTPECLVEYQGRRLAVVAVQVPREYTEEMVLQCVEQQ